MFRLSKASEYAIRGLLYMGGKPQGKVSYIEEIAKAKNMPMPYLAKLFHILVKRGILRSYRGPNGGFILVKNHEDITLVDIIEAIEGPIYFNECLEREGRCKEDAECPVYSVWKECTARFVDMLKSYSISKLGKMELLLRQKGVKRP